MAGDIVKELQGSSKSLGGNGSCSLRSAFCLLPSGFVSRTLPDGRVSASCSLCSAFCYCFLVSSAAPSLTVGFLPNREQDRLSAV